MPYPDIHKPDCACPSCCRDVARPIRGARELAHDNFGKLLSDAIQAKIEEAIVGAVEAAKIDVERKVRSSVGQIAANVLNHFSMEMRGTELVIRVDFGPQAGQRHPDVRQVTTG